MTMQDARMPVSSDDSDENRAESHGTTGGAPDGTGSGTAPDSAPGEPAQERCRTGWHKAYLTGSRTDLRVPVRRVHLTDGRGVTLYDTSGPYTDPLAETDVRRGLPPLREGWITDRKSVV